MTIDATGRGRAALVEDGVEFDDRDAALLRAIDRTGSVAGAASDLGRSRARALRRIETLEDVFDAVVERHRGGSDGGGSRLTQTGRDLLARYDRLAAALAAAASVPETVLTGDVTAVDGELATVATEVGDVRALQSGVAAGDAVQVRVGADAVTLHAPAEAPRPDATSARNRVSGRVAAIDPGETVLEVDVTVDDVAFRALVTADSATRLDLESGRDLVVSWKATATRLVPIE
ncbi:TOBE domain-containing protein [Natribaculum luteum]|uniref:TOBE domain-containing protein n=1 Tax=Natribaculum luteum TaxID=1586232 RepID=A0ABD5NWZ7_9EURY|nr:TOBE domain-containing protein [Natribaculum luteum]